MRSDRDIFIYLLRGWLDGVVAVFLVGFVLYLVIHLLAELIN